MKKPNFFYEKKFWQKGYQVLGLDEVGRGSLAGPLVVAAVCFSSQKSKVIESLGIKDSKKLSAKKREKLSQIIKKQADRIFISKINVSYINKYGISKAFQNGVRKIVNQMKKANKKIFILIDGFQVKYLRGVGLKNQKAIIKGDEKSISIAAASIIAKVYRDKLMEKLAKKYPLYHFDKNKGYGTKEHIKALRKYKQSPIHRLLFIRNFLR
jgi:ribonuclease HII